VAADIAGIEYLNRVDVGDQSYFGDARIAVGDQDVDGIEVVLRRPRTLTGVIEIEGSASLGSAAAISSGNLPVRVEPADGDPRLGAPWGRLSPGLSFEIQGLRPGRYVLRIHSSDLVKSILWNGNDYTYRPFDTSAGDIDGVRVIITDKVAKVSGRVASVGGASVSDLIVLCFPAERGEWEGYGFSPGRMFITTVAADGTYSYSRLPSGEYYLIAVDARAGGAWRRPESLAYLATIATRVSLAWGQERRLDLAVRLFR
jgi:hypothetical protein